MIKLDITGHRYELDENLLEYVEKKLGGLEKFLPKEVRSVAHGNVVLSYDPSGKEGNHYVCEGIVTVPHGKLQAKEGTGNMYAAIDLVEAKLKVQITRYKQKQHAKPKSLKLMVARFLKRTT